MRLTPLITTLAIWIGSIVILPVVLVGGYIALAYAKEPRAAAALGGASDHVARGNACLQYSREQTYTWRVSPQSPPAEPLGPVTVAAMEFEAALLQEPTNAKAALGLAECLDSRAYATKGAMAQAFYGRARDLDRGTLRNGGDPADLIRVQEHLARMHDHLGDHAASKVEYERLLAMQTDGISRVATHLRIAEQDEQLGNLRAALTGYRFLATVTPGPGGYADKARELQSRIAAQGKRER